MSRSRTLSWVAVMIWMSLIFYLSHQPATKSSELSTGVMQVILETVDKVAPNVTFDIEGFHHIVRKNAHFFAYLVLGVLTYNALRKDVRGPHSVALALGICVLYALSDEVHQLFISGRSGEVTDVLIDSAGASVGIGGYWIIRKIKQWRIY